MDPADECPRCFASATRPDVVWFGEVPHRLTDINKLALSADIFVVIGSSGLVYPAAELANIAARNGAHTCEINLEPTGGAFQTGLYGKASEIVPEWVERMLTTGSAG